MYVSTNGTSWGGSNHVLSVLYIPRERSKVSTTGEGEGWGGGACRDHQLAGSLAERWRYGRESQQRVSREKLTVILCWVFDVV